MFHSRAHSGSSQGGLRSPGGGVPSGTLSLDSDGIRHDGIISQPGRSPRCNAMSTVRKALPIIPRRRADSSAAVRFPCLGCQQLHS